jgi:GntR family transcriptional regulator
MTSDKDNEVAIQLDRSSVTALHEQLTDRLLASSRQLGRGGRLPSEEELMETYGVSRTTVRRAFRALVDQGILVRRQGKGTFVAGPHIVHKLDRLAPFVETLSTASEPHEGVLLDFRWISGAEIPQEFRIPVEHALAFRRLYVSGGIPHAVVQVVIPGWVASTLTRTDVEAHPVYDLLRKKLGLSLKRAEVSVSCRGAGRALAKPLKLTPSAPILVMKRITYDERDRAVESTVHHLRWDVYELRLRIQSDDLHTFRHVPKHTRELSFIAGPNRYSRKSIPDGN